MSNIQYSTPIFFQNNTTLSGVLAKQEASGEALIPFYILDEQGQYAIFLEAANEYLVKQFDSLTDGSYVTVNASIHQFPNGHYFFAEGFNTPVTCISGNCIRVDEPRQVNERTVINFAIAQSTSKEDQGTIINCSYWFTASMNKIAQKIKVGAFLAVSGSTKVGSYTKDGVEVPTIKVDVRHIATPRSSSISSGIMPMTKPTLPTTSPASPAPKKEVVSGPAIDF